MLILPTNYQLVGAVFVESTSVGSRSEGDLITSMDRQGFLHNDAFEQFVDFVRGGIEFLAKEDRASLQRAAERDAKAAARQTREDFKEAIKFIEDSPAIPKAEKNRLVKEYSGLTMKLQEVEDYDRVARQRLQAMSALGIVAGFMTYEASRIFASLGDILPELKRLARNHPTIRQDIEKFQKAYQALEGHIEYTLDLHRCDPERARRCLQGGWSGGIGYRKVRRVRQIPQYHRRERDRSRSRRAQNARCSLQRNPCRISIQTLSKPSSPWHPPKRGSASFFVLRTRGECTLSMSSIQASAFHLICALACLIPCSRRRRARKILLGPEWDSG